MRHGTWAEYVKNCFKVKKELCFTHMIIMQIVARECYNGYLCVNFQAVIMWPLRLADSYNFEAFLMKK